MRYMPDNQRVDPLKIPFGIKSHVVVVAVHLRNFTATGRQLIGRFTAELKNSAMNEMNQQEVLALTTSTLR